MTQDHVCRRDMLTIAGVGLFAATLPATARAGTPVAPSALSKQRAWAQQHMRGIENIFMPSFQADLKTLDEEGLRIEVRNSIAQGFFSTAVGGVWIRPDDRRWQQMSEIVLDEARGKMLVGGVVSGRGTDSSAEVKLICRCEKMGFTHIIVTPQHAPTTTADALYDSYRRRIESTDLPVSMYAGLGPGFAFPGLGPSGVPIDVFEKLADLPNVVAMKLTQPMSLTTAHQMCERLGDRVLMGPVNLDFVPTLARLFNIQWSGQWNAEAVQVPSRRLAVDLVKAAGEKDFKTAFAISDQMRPALERFYDIQAPTVLAGGHPWQHNKYWSWLGGGNGGLMPDIGATVTQMPILDDIARREMRAAFAASGLPVTDAPDEQFIVGRAAWARGVRAKDFPNLPRYAVG